MRILICLWRNADNLPDSSCIFMKDILQKEQKVSSSWCANINQSDKQLEHYKNVCHSTFTNTSTFSSNLNNVCPCLLSFNHGMKSRTFRFWTGWEGLKHLNETFLKKNFCQFSHLPGTSSVNSYNVNQWAIIDVFQYGLIYRPLVFSS